MRRKHEQGLDRNKSLEGLIPSLHATNLFAGGNQKDAPDLVPRNCPTSAPQEQNFRATQRSITNSITKGFRLRNHGVLINKYCSIIKRSTQRPETFSTRTGRSFSPSRENRMPHYSWSRSYLLSVRDR